MNNKQFLNWARVLAREYGGRLTVSEEEVRLDPSSEKWEQVTGSKNPLVLALAPKGVDPWRLRLRHVEKAAARAVISGPVGFSCSVEENEKRKYTHGPIDIIRLAFGLSLSVGHNYGQRYTAYYLGEGKEAFYISTQDRLFELCTNIQALDLNKSILKSGLQNILSLIKQVAHEYRTLALIQEQLKQMSEALSGELRDLDRLYTASYGQYAQLLGRAPDGLRGEDAIEAEYLNRMEDIMEKFKLCVVFKPLSLSIVRCKARIRKKGKATEITLPFVDNSFRIE